MLRVVSARDDREGYRRWAAAPAFAGLANHPFWGGFGQSYYPLVFGETRQDVSFAVLKGEVPVALVPCSRATDTVDYYGQPIRIFSATDAAEGENLLPFILKRLGELAEGRNVIVGGEYSLGSPAGTDSACAAAGLSGNPRFTALCDVTRGEEHVHPALRKSFRSLVNWGKKNLRLEYINGENPDRSAFAIYQDFHHRVAGRSTRAQSTWDAMFDWLAEGRGELVLSYLEDGALVAGTLIVDGDLVAYYASGVYDRERFDKPLTHWPLYNSILRSAMRGVSWFELGDVPVEGTVSAKEYNIGYFKRGFATDIVPWTCWSSVPQTPPAASHP